MCLLQPPPLTWCSPKSALFIQFSPRPGFRLSCLGLHKTASPPPLPHLSACSTTSDQLSWKSETSLLKQTFWNHAKSMYDYFVVLWVLSASKNINLCQYYLLFCTKTLTQLFVVTLSLHDYTPSQSPAHTTSQKHNRARDIHMTRNSRWKSYLRHTVYLLVQQNASPAEAFHSVSCIIFLLFDCCF